MLQSKHILTDPRRHPLDTLELARYIVDFVDNAKAEEILLLDLRPDTILADFFVVCTGNSDRHLRALSENLRQDIKEQFTLLPHSVDGDADSGWVILDYGDLVVHFFGEAEREYYALEQLWGKQANVLVNIQ